MDTGGPERDNGRAMGGQRSRRSYLRLVLATGAAAVGVWGVSSRVWAESDGYGEGEYGEGGYGGSRISLDSV